MTLIREGMDWPPAPFDRFHSDVAEASVWWEGTASELTSFYAGTSVLPSGFRGRVSAAVAAFWGKPTATAKPAHRLHVPVAADIANTSANLLFSSPPTFTVTDGDQKAQDRLDRIANTTNMHADLLVAGETCAALSGVFLRVVWDHDVAANAFIEVVDADRAIPEFRWGRLVAVTFFTEHRDHNAIYRHLERYTAGRIEHTLYKGDTTSLGRLVSLADHPATESIAAQVDMESSVETGTDLLAAVFIPNQKPNPAYRSDPILRHMGRGDLSRDLIPLMDALDETYSAWMRDVRLAKARLVVSENLTDSRGVGRGRSFDTDREIFETVNTVPDASGNISGLIQAHQFAIRVEEHQATAEALVREILRRVGYSPLTFGLTDAVAMTAAETAARERTSTQTREAKTRLWRPNLARLVRAQLEIDAFQFGTGVTVTEDVEVDWSQGTQETPHELGQTVSLFHAAQAASAETRVRMLHPSWDQEQIDAEVAKIEQEYGIALPDLGGVTELDFASGHAE